MVLSDRILEVVDLAYGAAVEPQLWTRVLERYADLVGGNTATITFQDQLTGKGRALSARLDPDAIPLYFGHFGNRNPIQKRNDLVAMQDGSWSPRIIHDEHQLPKPELVRSEYYNDFMRRFDMHSCLMMGLALKNMYCASLAVMRPRWREQFGPHEFAIANQLHPHMIRAFGISLKLSDMQLWQGGLEDALDRSRHAVFLLDSDGTLRHANRAGEGLLQAQRGLTLKHNALHACRPEDDCKLTALIGAAAIQSAENRCGGAIAIVRPGRKRPLSLTVAPIRSTAISTLSSGSAVLVCASDPEDGVAVPEQRLKDMFGLTRAEAGIAVEIMSGLDAKAISEKRSLSVHTVRMHIARILAKTDTRRQAELASLLLRSTVLS